MLTQTAPPPPYRPFGPPHMPGQNMMMPPRGPPPNMYTQGFNQFKQINIPPPAMIPPPSMGTDGPASFVPGMPSAFPGTQHNLDFDARRQQRRNLQRRTVDYNASVVQQIKNRVWRKTSASVPPIQPDVLYYADLAAPRSLIENPVNAVATRFVRTATNKIRCPIFSLSWTPEGRRLITGASSGEFTLWGGLSFNFETVLQAHESAVRAMHWSHNDTWLLSADHSGLVKYWQSNMNNVKTLQAHNDPVRGVGFSPTDNKFATCSDDGTVKIWDFYRCVEERVLRGHGADVKCIDWHPSKGLLVSGSKDSQQPLKLWDPKSGTSLSTIHIHKSTVMDLQWNMNGNWLLTASRDHLIKVFDIRAMKEIQTFKGHKKEATSVDWHPIHESLFASGGSDGAIMYWNMGSMKELGSMDHAHDAMIWSVRWHPLGHLLASGANDHTCKFWTRNRPGDKMRDKFNLNTNPLGDDDYEYDVPALHETSNKDAEILTTLAPEPTLPGLSLSSSVPIPASLTGIPGIDLSFQSADSNKDQQSEKQMLLQKARQSGFKLPNQNKASSLRADTSSFKTKTTSTFKIPNAGEVKAILEGKLKHEAGKIVPVGKAAQGLLPTPSMDEIIQPATSMKGIFDPLEIEAGFVIEANEVWIDEKLSQEKDKSLSEERLRKKERRNDHQSSYRDSFEGVNQNQGEFSNDNGRRRGHQRGHNQPHDGPRQQHPPGWREPPEKRRNVQHPPMFQSPEGTDDGPVDFRPQFQAMRGKGSRLPFDNRPLIEGGPENRSFHPNHMDDMPNQPASDRNEQHPNDGRWNEPLNPEWNDHQGYGGQRGRGRGFMNHSMQRQGPPFGRDGPSSNGRPPFNDGPRTREPLMGLSWRNAAGLSPDDRLEQNADGPTNVKNAEQEEGFLPSQRRGPHPLLRRGRGGPIRGGRKPPSFDGRGPGLNEKIGATGPIEGKDSPLNERTVPYANEDARLPAWAENQGIKGPMGAFSPNHMHDQKQWQVDRTAKGT